jgi:2-polyprenyl-3-methyl-5-hydroxy-6-metoxy-1,4-benzoquinol methylase
MRLMPVRDYVPHTTVVPYRNTEVNFYSASAHADGSALFRGFREVGAPAAALSGKRVLDVGCGFGGRPVYYAELGSEVVIGCDIYTDAVKQGARFAAVRGVGDRVRFYANGAEELALRAGSFDLVTS